jgi:hypothetical protein
MKTLTTILLFIATTIIAQPNRLTKSQSINHIKSYYANFKTGSYEVASKGGVKKYGQYTGNYKVVIDGCKFKISYDEISWKNNCATTIDYEVYNWDNPKNKNQKTIEFDCSEIDSIINGNREIGESDVINWNIRFYSAKSIKITNIPVIRNQLSDKEKFQFDLKINTENKEENDFSNIEIVKAFRRLIALCKTQ